MIDHLGVQVADVPASLDVYLRAFAPIGMHEVVRFPVGGSFVPRDADPGEVWVRIVARAETFVDCLDSASWEVARDARSLAHRLADHLQDWVAESRFGWGQWRSWAAPR